MYFFTKNNLNILDKKVGNLTFNPLSSSEATYILFIRLW